MDDSDRDSDGKPVTDEPGSRVAVEMMRIKAKSSKRLPPWMWAFISKSLGIKTTPREKPIVSVVLYMLTVGSATGMLIFRTWFGGYNIASTATQSDILDGLTVTVVCGLFCALGVYAHRLAYRLFVHPKFLDMMRLHSKTIVKMNAAAIVLFMMALFIVAINIHLSSYMRFYVTKPQQPLNETTVPDDTDDPNPCQTVDIPLWICQTYFVSQVIFSFFFLVWNGLVAMVLVSVARTHTVSIRRFICELDCDAYLIDKKMGKKLPNSKKDDNLYHYLWMDSGLMKRIVTKMEALDDGPNGAENGRWRGDSQASMTDEDCKTGVAESSLEESEPTFFASERAVQLELTDEPSTSSSRSTSKVAGKLGRVVEKVRIFDRFRKLSEDLDENDLQEEFEPHIMSNDEIMNKYWRLVTSTRLTSQAFQRWMCCTTTVIMIYSAIQIVYWLSHVPTLTGVISFVCPLLILPLLASAYAEVNYEGINVWQSVMPTDARSGMFRYLYGMPIHLTVYGHPVSYGTMTTVLAAILAAFASKILLKEMNTILD